MLYIRPIQAADYPALNRFAMESGHGFTSLPKDEGQLRSRIEGSLAAFASPPVDGAEGSHLFVLADSDSGEVLGTSGIEARVGLSDAFYHYHLSKVVHSSRELGIHNTVDVLTLCNDYTGATEICTLFLTPKARQKHIGRLLSKFRFLYMAQHPQGFAPTVVAEMRGVSDAQGQSPFWRWLQSHFFSMDLADAVHRVGMGQKSFIAELMPTYPVYVSLLDDAAQAVIGKVHQQTVPALKLLEQEGFSWRGYVDPFDAGPTVEAKRDQIRTARESRVYPVAVVDRLPSPDGPCIVTNTRRQGFRATLVPLQLPAEGEPMRLNAELAQVLEVTSGDTVRAVGLP